MLTFNQMYILSACDFDFKRIVEVMPKLIFVHRFHIYWGLQLDFFSEYAEKVGNRAPKDRALGKDVFCVNTFWYFVVFQTLLSSSKKSWSNWE